MRLLLLMPTTTYRAADFLSAAEKLGVEVVLGSDRCHQLEEKGLVRVSRDSLVLDFLHPEESAHRIVDYARGRAIQGVIACDEATAEIAARASECLGLPHNPPQAAGATRDKLAARHLFARSGVAQARYRELSVELDPVEAAKQAQAAPGFPCVLKPRMLSASRGVIRADDPPSFAIAFRRLIRLLADPEVKARGGEAARSILVESYLPGPEVAVEGLLVKGELRILAFFDKPDPLEGPFFEETLYVTPSRLPRETQDRVGEEIARGTRAVGLVEGPIHAELRLVSGRPHLLEIAARSIGGLCSRTLRFGSGLSLEEVLILHALGRGEELAGVARERGAAGVMMLPIPRSGVFRGVGGLEDAKALPGVVEVTITAVAGREILALPEGHAYLGFLFARGQSPEAVEKTLREAHARLTIEIAGSLRRTE